MIGRTLGPYRIVDKLGQGGMGEVYSASVLKTPQPISRGQSDAFGRVIRATLGPSSRCTDAPC